MPRSSCSVAACTFMLCSLLVPAIGQTVQDAVLMIDLENVVWYGNEATDPAKLMTSAAVTPLPTTFVYPFKTYLLFGDVAAVNGKPARGTFIARGAWLALSTADSPVPQRPIADVGRNQIFDFLVEFLTPEKVQVGTLAALGFGAGGAPPGTPPGSGAGNFVVTGGSGVYAGARGQGATVSAANLRITSAIEDPAYRRINGGGKWRIGVTLYSVPRPELVAVYHGSDFTPVSTASPAASGETLILAIKGLGPTRPVLEIGKAFPDGPFAQVASPVEITFNEKPGVVLNSIGWPGSAEYYRVDVTVPGGLDPGAASLRVSSAWIPGAEYKVPVK